MNEVLDSFFQAAMTEAATVIVAPSNAGARLVIRRIVLSVPAGEDISAIFHIQNDVQIYPTINIGASATIPLYDSGLMEYRLPPNKFFGFNPTMSDVCDLLVQYSILG